IDLSAHELVVLSVDREARAIALLSPTYAFNRVIPLRSVCDVRLVVQDERRGALVTFLNEMKLPVHLCLQSTDFSTLFDPQAFCAAVTPFLPFPSKELPTKVIRKEKRSLSQQAWEYLRGLVVAPNSFQSTRMTLKQYEYIIAVYLCFLLLLRGDLLSLV
ncbi:hypothetical protein WA556_005142, partial [Blastocystis sp. ATCC 50177/Nand II]